MLTLYTYSNCSTCRNAVKWLRARGVTFTEKPIRQTPPALSELQAMANALGGVKPLLNTSGQDYRDLGLKDKLPAMTADVVLEMLAGNGNLIRRPFAIDERAGIFLTGFREQDWEKCLA